MSAETITYVKICGISEPETLRVAIDAGARFIGFVFYPPSPRHISLDTAFQLARSLPTGVRSVALFVDPDDLLLDQVLGGGMPVDLVQLHGDESAQRIAEIKARYNIPVMKAIRVGAPEDLQEIEALEAAADWLLFDAKPPKADLPGGTGHSFEWDILAGRTFSKPWMLGGGLNAGNVAEALSILKPTAVDVSSGVEGQRGIKDADKIKAFIHAVKQAK